VSRTPPSDKSSDPAVTPAALPDTAAPPSVTNPTGGTAGRLRLEAGAEPAPGFTLVQCLGRGGFGEVWKATGPGGFPVAMKFIPLGEQAGAVELRALALMKDARHANLLGQFGAWKRNGVLIVAMELADRTLSDRLREAVREGLPGIPRAELLDYLQEAAKGLDHLNGLGVQHRDVKPQNLLLVGGSVKVADFGLAKVLEQSRVSHTGAMTPAYAAPEFLRKEVSAHSDQYSLAVSYCQLRGGRLPFTGDQAQMVTGHLMFPPDLTMLPAAERPALAKALAKKPEGRWPSCRAFAEAVAAAGPDDADTLLHASTPAAAGKRRWPAAVLVGVLLLLTAALPVALIWSGVLQSKPGNADAPGRAADDPPPQPDKNKAAPPPAKDKDKVAATPPDKDKVTSPPQPPQPRPALRLPALPAVALAAGETKTIAVRVERDHCPGPVRLEVVGLPDGVRARPVVVPDGQDAADVELTAADAAAPGAGRGTLTARAGEARADGPLSVTVVPGKVYTNTLGMKLKWIEPGTFTMGSPDDEDGRSQNEGPAHDVTITRPFYLGVYPVTKGQFAAFVQDAGKTEAEADGKGGWGFNAATRKLEGRDPKYTWRDTGWEQTDAHPVVNVTWNDAQKFCQWLSKKEGKVYELPTEAEWEYACRAGTTTRFWCGDKDDDLQGNANLADASLKAKLDPDLAMDWGAFQSWDDGRPFTSPVGAFKPNPWGLFDMHGNVWQWCADRYGSYKEGSLKDPKGPTTGGSRVLRGGSWFDYPRFCRAARRNGVAPGHRDANIGFRVVLRPPAGTP
jgi:formylglycine-generating enzyme required for sulfatase activity